jgi:hypothetical protein
MAEVMDGAITADTGIITGGVVATTMVGGITTTGELASRSLAQAGTAQACFCSSHQVKRAPALRARKVKPTTRVARHVRPGWIALVISGLSPVATGDRGEDIPDRRLRAKVDLAS